MALRALTAGVGSGCEGEEGKGEFAEVEVDESLVNSAWKSAVDILA